MDDGRRRNSLASDSHTDVHVRSRECGNYPLATLTMAAEHVAFYMPDKIARSHAYNPPETLGHNQRKPVGILPEPSATVEGHAAKMGLKHSIDELAIFLEDGERSSYQFPSFVSVEQPIPTFWPESTCHTDGPGTNIRPPPTVLCQSTSDQGDEAGLLFRLGPRPPTIQPEDQGYRTGYIIPSRKSLSEVSLDDRRDILSRLAEFSSFVPVGFQLPSRLALSRYIAAYINGFHEHLPFLHISTMSISRCPVELILAMAAVGAQYCFEDEKAIELFHASKKIAIVRLRRRDVKLAVIQEHHAISRLVSSAEGMDGSVAPHLRQSRFIHKRISLPPESPLSQLGTRDQQDLLQPTQALLILMVLATWAKHKELLREAFALQSMLSTLVRDDGLRNQPAPPDIAWEDWIEVETIKRTKFIIYCFFNLHCIVYNIPSLILNSELNFYLPCSAAEFEAPTRLKWLEKKGKVGPEVNFQTAFNRLFSHGGNEITESNSSLGNYILIHAIIQHIFFLRQFSCGGFDGYRNVAPEDIAATEQALRNWQSGWKRSLQSAVDPQDLNGPVVFNSTALLRLAYIRLNIDMGPGMALDTRDPVQIAKAFRASPRIKRTPKLIRTVLHSAQALSIPVKTGIRLVAQAQTCIWSIQHSLCSLECALLLSKWLEALSHPNPDPPATADEQRIMALVKMMLDETEFAISPNLPPGSPAAIKQMNAGVLRVWAKIFKGVHTWAIVDVIGTSLNVYADMIEGD
ncbi:hypothetical protein AJ78_06797 [Emergomyces pasteurianus Ep9510]|uniref:Xylanolytic transcriptional activator regulatory domain-containing protein n=1 Tax=Emergomyces pasteurianus Ep9510 TaxID=1447872 RepID=A0A1J9P9M9_9EURO|nr:hypothetical protein AJ78_06797 [Emergomyces pasteurianus Ep9510]